MLYRVCIQESWTPSVECCRVMQYMFWLLLQCNWRLFRAFWSISHASNSTIYQPFWRSTELATTTDLLSLPSSNQFSSQPLVSPVQRSAKLMTRAQKMQQMAAMNDCLRLNQHTSCFPCTQTCSIHVLELICIDWTSSLGRGGATPSYLSTQKDSAERESGYHTVGQMKLSSGYFHPCRLERSTWDW